jgi:hypothetical protein
LPPSLFAFCIYVLHWGKPNPWESLCLREAVGSGVRCGDVTGAGYLGCGEAPLPGWPKCRSAKARYCSQS